MVSFCKTYCLVTVIVCTLLSACETIVDVEVPRDPPRLTPNLLLEAEEPVLLELSQSQSILTNRNDQERVAGAIVTLQEEGEVAILLKENEEPGIYRSSYRPAAGKSYTLKVTKEGFESVEATTSIPSTVAIKGVTYDTAATYHFFLDQNNNFVEKESIEVSEVQITFDDPIGDRNFYELRMHYNSLKREDTFDEQGNYIATDSIWQYSTLYLESDDPAFTGSGGDFIEGGVYGEVLTFSDEIMNGKTYTLRVSPQNSNYESVVTRKLHVVLRSITEGRYQYFQSADLQYQNDGNPFAEPVQVYTNVANGYGIFAGSNADSVVVDLE